MEVLSKLVFVARETFRTLISWHPHLAPESDVPKHSISSHTKYVTYKPVCLKFYSCVLKISGGKLADTDENVLLLFIFSCAARDCHVCLPCLYSLEVVITAHSLIRTCLFKGLRKFCIITLST